MSRMRWPSGPAAVLSLAVGLVVTLGAPAQSQAGPSYSVPEDELRAALECPEGLEADGEPVLLVHATFTYAAEQFSWNWGRGLPARGLDHCLVSYADRGFGDQQVAAEYVAYAIREVHRRTGRQVDVVGHSQGGLVTRWAVTFWPPAREAVDDLVSLAVPHHGLGSLGEAPIALGARPASFWQFATGSRFLSALNRGDETPGGIDYTQLYSASDGLTGVLADRLTTALDAGSPGPGVSNVLLQDICPRRVVGHVAMGTVDRLTFELAVDALTHEGPADPARLQAGAVCGPPASIVEGGPATALPRLVVGALVRGVPDLHLTQDEPALQPYAR